VYARSTTIMAEPSQAERGIAFVREQVWPMVRDMDGCLGLSLVIDRQSGRSITTTSWDSEETLRASAEMVRGVRAQGVELTSAMGEPAVEEWEIASMHRAHHTGSGACVRAAWSRVPAPYVDRALAFYKNDLLPHIEQLDGFVSASLMIDRPSGRSVLSVAYESREAMERTRNEADYLRARSTQEANVEFLDVGEFELVIAHLHVPEFV
jgi:quinol monooxygenase YgiN